MPVLGVTGGIATGKTTFTAKITTLLLGEVFDADRAARMLLDENEEIRQKVREEFGAEVLRSTGAVDRGKLREAVFGDDRRRRKLEAILHPAIRAAWLARLAGRRAVGERGWMVLEIPLLYETQAEDHMDAVAVVACSPETQRRRLIDTRNLSESMALKMMTAQLELSAKIEKADHVIWNDGQPRHLDAQAEILAQYLQASHE